MNPLELLSILLPLGATQVIIISPLLWERHKMALLFALLLDISVFIDLCCAYVLLTYFSCYEKGIQIFGYINHSHLFFCFIRFVLLWIFRGVCVYEYYLRVFRNVFQFCCTPYQKFNRGITYFRMVNQYWAWMTTNLSIAESSQLNLCNFFLGRIRENLPENLA